MKEIREINNDILTTVLLNDKFKDFEIIRVTEFIQCLAYNNKKASKRPVNSLCNSAYKYYRNTTNHEMWNIIYGIVTEINNILTNYNYDKHAYSYLPTPPKGTTFYPYNRHPECRNTTDCVCRAISTATGCDYVEIRKHMNNIKNLYGYPNYKSKNAIEDILQGHEMTNLNDFYHQTTSVNDLLNNLPQGRYVVLVNRHLTTIINGCIYDTWNCGNEIVKEYWKIK